MPSLPILAVVPREQVVAAGGPQIFNVPFQFFVPTDLLVYRTPVNTVPNDAANLLLINADYTVVQNVITYTGTVTLAVNPNAGDIITIVRNIPNTRANFYIPGGPFTTDAINTDFESEVLMIQQNNNVLLNISPRYQFTEMPLFPNDIMLPVLGPNEIWAKDTTGTFIEAISLPNPGDVVVPTVPFALAYFTNNLGQLASLAAMTNGQIAIGSTGAIPIIANITPGAGIAIMNAAGSITITNTGGGGIFTWHTSVAPTPLLAFNGYITNNGGGVTYTLPAAGAIGDTIIILGELGLTTIAQNALQQIRVAGNVTTVGVGGSLTGTNVGDCITLICIVAGANTVWRASSFVGNWAYA